MVDYIKIEEIYRLADILIQREVWERWIMEENKRIAEIDSSEYPSLVGRPAS